MSSNSHDLPRKALGYLHNCSSPCTALQVSKGIGLSTAKEINPTLYALEKQGHVQRMTSGKKVVWQCVQGSVRNRLESNAFDNAVEHNAEEPVFHQSFESRDDPEPSRKHVKTERQADQYYDCDQDVDMEPLQEEEGPKSHQHQDMYHGKRAHDEMESYGSAKTAIPHEADACNIPKAPHEILKPVGPRTAMIADALYRRSDERQATEYIATERTHPHSFFDMEEEIQSQSTYNAHYGRQSNLRMQALPESPMRMQPLMGMNQGQMFHQDGNEASDRLVESILEFLKQFNRPVATLEIAKAVNRKTKKEINPTLYDLQRRGLIVKTSSQPPAWKLATTTSSARSSSWSQQGYSGNYASDRQQDDIHNREGSLSVMRPHFGQLDERARQLSWPGEEETQPKQFAIEGMHPERQGTVAQRTSPRLDQTTKELSSMSFTALNKNPVSAINEYAQKNQQPISFELLHEGKGGMNRFLVAVKLGGRMYDAVSAGNMKDAKREAADVALREILSKQESKSLASQSRIVSNDGLTHFDQIAMLSVSTFMKFSTEVQDKFAGRKVIAAIVKKTYGDEAGVVVSLGAGNRCITGDRLTLDGKTVNDSHAEIICRRAFLRYLYSELEKFANKNDSIFEQGRIGGRLQVKDDITWHLYISTAPCGDGALFSPREANKIDPTSVDTASRDHSPLYTSKQQGLLRTKVEDGEGTIPIDPNEGPQTWDGIIRGNRLRTMSCTDKICRWNVLGMQGALLSHIIEPIYLDSLTLGYLYEHGHLARALCCRLSKDSDIDEKLPMPYSLNHPWLGRVTAFSPSRETQKTNNLSVNWYLGSTGMELTDGRTGACLTRTDNAPTPSRLCKAELYKHFKWVCAKQRNLQHLNAFETYREAKEKAYGFQEAKAVMAKQFKASRYGTWVKKPRELEMFDV